MPDIKKLAFNDKQLEIVKALSKGTNKFFLEGGVRSGKSLIACWMIDYICTHMPGMEAYIYRDTYESIRKDTHRIFKDNPGFLAGKGTWHEGSKEFHYASGSKIFFQYTKGGRHTLGQTAGLIYFEQIESIKEEDYNLILPRLSQWGPAAQENYMRKWSAQVRAGQLIKPRNFLLLSANPRANWIKSRYIDTDGKPDLKDKVSGQIYVQDNLRKENIKRFHLSTYDNIQNLGEEYLSAMQTASEAFKKQYYDGSWTFNTGLIYPEFMPTDYADGGNVVNFEWEIENDINFKNLRTIVAIDPGYVKSKFVALACAILPDNTYYIFDELQANGKNAEEWDKIGPTEFAARLKALYKERGFAPSKTIIDPAAHNENSGIGSVSGQLLKAGISAVSAKKTKEYQTIMSIKDLLKGRKIIVNARCQGLIKEFGLFAWDERASRSGDQQPLDEDNDFLDALRYIVVDSPHPQTQAQSYKQVFDKSFAADRQYQNWLAEWYGQKQKKPNPIAIDNKRKGNWGI